MFQPVIADRLRRALHLADTSPESLGQIKGIILAADVPEAKFTGIDVPWFADSAAFKMKLPDVVFDVQEFTEGWQSELGALSQIKSLYLLTPIDDLQFIRQFPALEELYIKYTPCADWSFLEALPELRMLFVRKCPNFDINALGLVADAQVNHTEWFANKLRYIYLGYCNIRDLSVLRKFKRLDELDLSHNAITDISPLAETDVFCLTLRYNQLTDLSALAAYPYLLNIRHNHVHALPRIPLGQLRRLFIMGNPIIDLTPIAGVHLVDTDIDDSLIPEAEDACAEEEWWEE